MLITTYCSNISVIYGSIKWKTNTIYCFVKNKKVGNKYDNIGIVCPYRLKE